MTTNYDMAKATGFQGTFKEYNQWRFDMSWAKDAWSDGYDYMVALGFSEQEAVDYADKRVEELKELNYTPKDEDGNK